MAQKITSRILYILGISIFCILPTHAFSATLDFSPFSVTRTVGSTFSLAVQVSSADKAMNAASGVVSFPLDKLEVVSVSKAGSIFSLWPEEPSFSNNLGTISFEGIVLNPGFTGSNGKILTITFRVRSAGQATVNFASGTVLANDGVGTNILTRLGTATIATQVIPVVQEVPVSDPILKIIEEPKKITVLEAPIITYYQEEVESGDLIKIQGITHPGADVEINLFRLGVLVQTKLARSTASGNFVITIDAPSQPGSYTFTGYSIDEAGNRSEESAPFTVIVNPVWFDEFVKSILSYASLFVLLALGLIGFIISTLFIWYRSMRIIRSMKQESREADQVLEESFALLHNSVASHIARLQSVDRELTKEEVIFLEQFEKELAGAKNVVSKEIKDISQ